MLNRPLLRTKVLRSLYSHTKCERRGAEVTLSEYQTSVEQCYDLHLFILDLLNEVVEYALERQRIAASKLRPTEEDLNPKTRFVENPIIASIKFNEKLQGKLRSSRLSWGENEQVIREVYNQIINAPFYAGYIDGVGKDRDFIIQILETLIEDNEVVCSALEDMSILWADDLGYALSQALYVIEKGKETDILAMYKSDEDRVFGEKLLLHSISHSEEYVELIDSLSENWEMDRIAYMDRMILVVAISELVSCPTIPTKVTLNEYIEISKYYSTDTSYNFINGVLHKAIDLLTAKGRIKKTGRGLIDGSVKK